MNPVFGSRQRAATFAALVDAPAAVAGRTTAGAGGPVGPELARLLDLVATLRAEAAHDQAATPRAAFATDLRERLVAEAATTLLPHRTSQGGPGTPAPAQSARTRGPRERVLAAAAAAAIIVGGTAGVASAAQTALPGEVLYPIKRGIERTDAQLSGSPTAEGRDVLGHATNRLREVRGLEAGGPEAQALIPRTLDEFTRQAHRGAELMMRGFRETDNPSAIAEVRAFAADQLPILASLSGGTSDGAQSELLGAAVALHSIDEQASDACYDCSDLAPVEIPTLVLASLDLDPSEEAALIAGLGSEDPGWVQEGSADESGQTTADDGTALAVGPEAAVPLPPLPLPPLLPDPATGGLGLPPLLTPAGTPVIGSAVDGTGTLATGVPADEVPDDSSDASVPPDDPDVSDPPSGSTGSTDPSDPEPPAGSDAPDEPDAPESPNLPDQPGDSPSHGDPDAPDDPAPSTVPEDPAPSSDPGRSSDPSPSSDPNPSSDPSASSDPSPSSEPSSSPDPARRHRLP